MAGGVGFWKAVGSGSGGLAPFKLVSYSGGDISVTSTSFVDLAPSDITIDASTGDVLMVGLNCAAENNGSTNAIRMDAVTRVSGAGVNRISGGSEGVPAWRSQGTAFLVGRGGPFLYTVVSGDLSSGEVTLRLQANVSGGTATIKASAGFILHWWVQNLGPAS